MKNGCSQKRKGRFIKKDHPSQKNLHIENFNLLEVSEKPITRADNSSSNIIHKRYHEEKELKTAIAPFTNLNRKFILENFRPVIKPLNFTNDWQKRIDYFQKHKSNLDEIEEIDPVFQKITENYNTEKNVTEDQSDQSDAPNSDEQDPIQGEEEIIQEPDQELNPDQQPLTAHSPLTISQTNESSLDQGENHQHYQVSQSHSSNEEFVPMQEAKHFNTSNPSGVKEVVASQEKLEEEYESAKKLGYQDGYKDGEEKAFIQGQSEIENLSSKLKDAITEMERLKSNILVSTQENFVVLCKSLTEALINYELNINEKGFQSLIKRAIEEAVPNDSFEIFVSKNAYSVLENSADKEFLNKVKISDSLEGFNFKIDSNLTVVDGNIRDMIEDLLEQANVDLFDNGEQVS